MLCSYLDFIVKPLTLFHTPVSSLSCNLYNWLCDYLTERKQQVVLNGESSSWTTVISGVPQGSVLGPLLSSLFVNDLPSIVKSPLVLFADDAKIYRSIQSDEDYQILQQDLDNLYKWSQDWQLCFSVTKCKVLHIGFKQLYKEYKLGNFFFKCREGPRNFGWQ